MTPEKDRSINRCGRLRRHPIIPVMLRALFVRPAVVVASLLLASAAAGCGPMPFAPAPSPTKTASGSSGSAQRATVVHCLQSHGVSLQPGATDKQVRSAFAALPAAQRQSVFAACASTLPSKLRQQFQAQMG
jgi:hypothetical protein